MDISAGKINTEKAGFLHKELADFSGSKTMHRDVKKSDQKMDYAAWSMGGELGSNFYPHFFAGIRY